MSKNGEIYTAGKNFTLPPALTAWTNSTSASGLPIAVDVILCATRNKWRGQGKDTRDNLAGVFQLII